MHIHTSDQDTLSQSYSRQRPCLCIYGPRQMSVTQQMFCPWILEILSHLHLSQIYQMDKSVILLSKQQRNIIFIKWNITLYKCELQWVSTTWATQYRWTLPKYYKSQFLIQWWKGGKRWPIFKSLLLEESSQIFPMLLSSNGNTKSTKLRQGKTTWWRR